MNQKPLVELLGNLVKEEGVLHDVIEGVNLFRITESSPRCPQTYDPGIIILVQGSKRLFLGDQTFTYDPLNYIVLSVPLPLECETSATADEPLLGIRISVEAAAIAEILLEMDDTGFHPRSLPMGIYSAGLDQGMFSAVQRLLQALSDPSDKKVLAPMIVKELIYRVLRGEKGDALRALAYRNQRFFQIARVLDKIHESYKDKLELTVLAREAGMSISAFHTNFRAVTNTTPLQYIKNVRLHKARTMMMERGINAHNAAYHVCYESASQFNREYKRFFGVTPGRDARR